MAGQPEPVAGVTGLGTGAAGMGVGAFGLTGATGFGTETTCLGTGATGFGAEATGLGSAATGFGAEATGLGSAATGFDTGATGLGALGERGWASTTTLFPRSKIAAKFPQKTFILLVTSLEIVT